MAWAIDTIEYEKKKLRLLRGILFNLTSRVPSTLRSRRSVKLVRLVQVRDISIYATDFKTGDPTFEISLAVSSPINTSTSWNRLDDLSLSLSLLRVPARVQSSQHDAVTNRRMHHLLAADLEESKPCQPAERNETKTSVSWKNETDRQARS